MHIIIPCFLDLTELPPAINVIDLLLQDGHTVSVISLFKNEASNNIFGNKVKYYSIIEKRPRKIKKFENNYHYLVIKKKYDEFLIQKKAKKIFNIIDSIIDDDSTLWIMHEYTASTMGRKLINNGYKYIFSVFELDNNVENALFLKEVSQKALSVVVPEYNRAHILKAWWRLEKLPFILPNKPSYHPRIKNMNITDEKTNKIIKSLEGKKIILYLGIFMEERRLDTIIEAVKRMGDDYVLVFMGHKSPYLNQLLRIYKNEFVYLDYTAPPNHLQVASHAHIGILTYVAVSKSINPLFCAPNKLYEYAGFGIPMLCNDIPGLKYQVEYSNIGTCSDIEKVNDICESINKIETNYGDMSYNAMHYFDSCDIQGIIRNIINSIKPE